MDYIHVTKDKAGNRIIDGGIVSAAYCNSLYLEGKLAETVFNKRLRKYETIKGRSIMNEDDYTETVIDCLSGMEGL